MNVTLKEVAERAGVSRSAVSRTFTDGASVSDKTRRKVEKAALELAYAPSLIARSLTTRRTKLVGLIANNFQNPVFLEVFDLYTEALQRLELRPLLVNMIHETDPARSVSMLRQYNVDGVIVASSTLPSTFAKSFQMAGVPVVQTFGKFDDRANVHVVGINNVQCGQMAAQTLIDRGYKNIAVIAGPKMATSTQDRVHGFIERLKARGREAATVRYASAYSYKAGLEACEKLLAENKVEAIFCGDDLVCMGAMDAARSSGLRVPDDIGFLGFNDMSMAGWRAYDLTTIRQPVRDIILSSVELVVATINDPGRMPEVRLFPCTIIERGSLRPLP